MDKKEISYVVIGDDIDCTFVSNERTIDLIIYLVDIDSPCVKYFSENSKLYNECYIDDMEFIDETYDKLSDHILFHKPEDCFVSLDLDMVYNKNFSAHEHILDFVNMYKPKGHTIRKISADEKIKTHEYEENTIITIVGPDLNVEILNYDINHDYRLFRRL